MCHLNKFIIINEKCDTYSYKFDLELKNLSPELEEDGSIVLYHSENAGEPVYVIPAPYMFDSAASETAQLSDWVCLGTLYSGGVVNLEVLLEVPVTLGNEYSGQTGYLDWEFKVEEFPVENDDPVPPTGDTFNRPLWFAILGGAGFLLILLFILRKRREEA